MPGEQDNGSSNPARRQVLLVGASLETVLWTAAVVALVLNDDVAWALFFLVLGTVGNFLLWRYALGQ